MQEQIENQLIHWLSSTIDYCGIRLYPDKPMDYFLKHNIGEILVRYDSTKWKSSEITTNSQEGIVKCELILVFRKLRGNQGLYHTINHIRNAIYGKKITNSTSPIQFDTEDLIGEEKGIWQYGIKISFGVVFVAQMPEYVEIEVAKEISLTINQKNCGS
jgi:hypothetical protein